MVWGIDKYMIEHNIRNNSTTGPRMIKGPAFDRESVTNLPYMAKMFE